MREKLRKRRAGVSAVAIAAGAVAAVAVVVYVRAGSHRTVLVGPEQIAQTFRVQAPTSADAAAEAAHLWAGAQIGKSLPFVQQNKNLPDRHEAYYTVHANNQKEAAQIAVEVTCLPSLRCVFMVFRHAIAHFF